MAMTRVPDVGAASWRWSIANASVRGLLPAFQPIARDQGRSIAVTGRDPPIQSRVGRVVLTVWPTFKRGKG